MEDTAQEVLKLKKKRFVVLKRDEQFVYVRDLRPEDDGPAAAEMADGPAAERGESAGVAKLIYNMNAHVRATAAMLRPGMQVNALELAQVGSDVFRPARLIVEPDELLDVSALTACVRPFGSSPYNFLLKKFDRDEKSAAMLLGDVANQMLDDCVNDRNATAEGSLRQAFLDGMLDFCTTSGIDQKFFADCKQQFAHIQAQVRQMRMADGAATLEPSFFCESLGLQGRFDLLSRDGRLLLELKSGKWDEWNKREQEAHLLQMLLYKEILFYNLGFERDETRGLLFYSKYPQVAEGNLFQSEMVDSVLTLRNQIVVLEHLLCEGQGRAILTQLTPERLKTQNCAPKLWEVYCRPPLAGLLDALHGMDELTADYFYRMLRFLANEQRLSRIGDGRLESTRGMANLWNADLDLKRANGDILTDLTLADVRRHEDGSVVALRLRLNEAFDTLPSFRVGDAVLVYRRRDDGDNATNQQLLRCGVEQFEEGFIWLRLRHRQRMNVASLQQGMQFAVEHDHIEASFRSLYSGLFALVQAPKERRDLLLCQRKPEPGKDYSLIVGPPGTGKTSVALRGLVEQWLAEGKTMLLMAYTNRAVDEICGMLGALDYLRLGKELSCDARYQDHLFSHVMDDCTRRSEVVECLAQFRIVVSTVASMSAHLNLFNIKQFDLAVFDEASQILEPQMLPVLCAKRIDGTCAIPRFVMIGDHKQLPAVVAQTEEETAVDEASLQAIGLSNCRNSLFERLHHFVKDDPGVVRLLSKQGRMHEDIAAFANEQFYGGQLDVVPLPHQRGPLPFVKSMPENAVLAQNRMVFVPVAPPLPAERQVKLNEGEAAAIAQVVKQLENLAALNGLDFSAAKHVGIIVPFRRQIVAIRHALERVGVADAWDILIDTVERYQGSQKDCIIFGTTISQEYELELLSSIVDVDGTPVDRKLNVAVTRARKQFILVGNKALLECNSLYSLLVKKCAEWVF